VDNGNRPIPAGTACEHMRKSEEFPQVRYVFMNLQQTAAGTTCRRSPHSPLLAAGAWFVQEHTLTTLGKPGDGELAPIPEPSVR